MRTTITIDPDVYEAVLHLSRVSGARLGKVLSDLARRGLQPAAPVRKSKVRRFPVFANSLNAPKLSMAKLQKVIDDEGYL